MKNVRRPGEPASLKGNGARWKRELLAKVKDGRKHKIRVPDKFFDRYKKPDIKRRLEKMYGGLCCYCESQIGVVDYPHIEHRKPKRLYPENAYDWDNLHLACTICNVSKGDAYDEEQPILDAAIDEPIDDHLTYKFVGMCLLRWPISCRGATTIEHTGISDTDARELLCQTRTKVYHKALNVVYSIIMDPRSPDRNLKERELRNLAKEEYGSAISYAMQALPKDDSG